MDGIPALVNPRFVTAAEATYLTPGEPVFGVEIAGDAHRGELQLAPLRPHLWPRVDEQLRGGIGRDDGADIAAVDHRAPAVSRRMRRKLALELELPRGRYEGEWLDAVSGESAAVPAFEHAGGVAVVRSPALGRDAALGLTAR